MTLVNQPTAQPTRKVKAFFGTGSAAAVLMGLVAIFWPDIYARVPPGFEAGLAVMFGSIAAYFTRDRL